LVWHRQYKENSRNVNSLPQSNIQILHLPRRSALRSLKRRQRVSPLADEIHHKDDLVVAAAAAMMMMVMTVVMTAKVVVVCLARGHRGSVCGVLLIK